LAWLPSSELGNQESAGKRHQIGEKKENITVCSFIFYLFSVHMPEIDWAYI